MAEEEKFLQEINEPKAHTDDPHDSATKDAIDGYIEIDTFKPGNQTGPKNVTTKKVKEMTYTRGTGWVEVDAKLPRKK